MWALGGLPPAVPHIHYTVHLTGVTDEPGQGPSFRGGNPFMDTLVLLRLYLLEPRLCYTPTVARGGLGHLRIARVV